VQNACHDEARRRSSGNVGDLLSTERGLDLAVAERIDDLVGNPARERMSGRGIGQRFERLYGDPQRLIVIRPRAEDPICRAGQYDEHKDRGDDPRAQSNGFPVLFLLAGRQVGLGIARRCQAISDTGNCLDGKRLIRIVRRKFAELADAPIDGVVADRQSAPAARDKITLGNDGPARLRQDHQHLHDPALQGLGSPIIVDFAPCRPNAQQAEIEIRRFGQVDAGHQSGVVARFVHAVPGQTLAEAISWRAQATKSDEDQVRSA